MPGGHNFTIMATFVLVHGGNMSAETWNRLSGKNRYPPGMHLGPRYWEDTAAFLRDHGHTVLSPALGDEFTHSLSDHIARVCDLITENDLRGIILAGHSYGGFVITSVAARLPKRVRNLVYLDSALPEPGESLMDILGWVYTGTHAALLPGPSLAYTEKIRYDPATIRGLRKTYIRCTKSEFSAVTSQSREKIAAAPGGWAYLEIPSSHVPMADRPRRLNGIMLSIAGR